MVKNPGSNPVSWEGGGTKTSLNIAPQIPATSHKKKDIGNMANSLAISMIYSWIKNICLKYFF